MRDDEVAEGSKGRMRLQRKSLSADSLWSGASSGSFVELKAHSPSLAESVLGSTVAQWFGLGGSVQGMESNPAIVPGTPRACDIVMEEPDDTWPPPLPGYKYFKKLGEGTYAVVMLAVEEDGEDMPLVAIKAIKKSITREDLIMREVRGLARVKHPHVESMLGSVDGEEVSAPGWYFIITEYASGGELFDRIIEHGSFSEKSAAMVTAQILDALACLHANGIIHRDLKPENILLARENSKLEKPHILLADFGTAKLSSPTASGRFGAHLRAVSYVGSLLYIAPEIFSGRGTEAYTEAVDLWSVGVILFILLSGDPPFDDRRDGRAASPVDFARIVMAGLPEAFNSIPFNVPGDSEWANVSPQACDLVRRLLSTDPRQRPTASQALNHAWFHSFGLAKASSNASSFSFSAADVIKSRVRQRSRSSARYISSLRQFTETHDDGATPKRARVGTAFKSPRKGFPEMY